MDKNIVSPFFLTHGVDYYAIPVSDLAECYTGHAAGDSQQQA